ncbi:MAG: hemolysin family protein [Caulobacterales bacterium]
MSDADHLSNSKSTRPPWWGRIQSAWRVLRGKEGAIEAAIREAEETPEEAPEMGGRRRMLLKVAEFDSLRVKDVMIPRADIEALDADTPFDEVLTKFADAAVSRMPLYRSHLDDPVGVIHVKDVLSEMTRRMREGLPPTSSDKILMKLRRDVLFVPPSMRLSVLLVKMQSARCHMALVIDEYGGTDGLLSIEDLVEQVVGDIEDEHDESESLQMRQRAIGLWEIDARASIASFAETSGLDLALPDWEEDIDTLGGLVFTLLGRVPTRGEIVRHPSGAELQVLDADPRRITRLQIRAPLAEPANAESTDKGDQ